MRKRTGRRARHTISFVIVLALTATLVAAVLWRSRGVLVHASSRPVTVLFDGFVFKGHGEESFTTPILPARFEAGTEYVFRHRLPLPVEPVDFGINVFPMQLRDLGFHVITAPKPNGEGMLILDSGGPVYSIVAAKKACQVTITHIVNQRLLNSPWPWDRNWEPADYIMVVSDSCSL